jgi:predicted restriction endonuclease
MTNNIEVAILEQENQKDIKLSEPPITKFHHDTTNTPMIMDDSHEQREAQNKNEYSDVINYSKELKKSFNRPGKTELKEQMITNGKVKNHDRHREKSYEKNKEQLNNEPTPKERRKETIRTILEGPDEQVREYLSKLYGGRCQICGKTFSERDGKPFFIANYIVPGKLARFVNTEANALCLCAEHFAKWQHGAIEADNILEQIDAFRTESEGGNNEPIIKFKLCGEKTTIKFKEKHLLELQELIKASGRDNE